MWTADAPSNWSVGAPLARFARLTPRKDWWHAPSNTPLHDQPSTDPSDGRPEAPQRVEQGERCSRAGRLPRGTVGQCDRLRGIPGLRGDCRDCSGGEVMTTSNENAVLQDYLQDQGFALSTDSDVSADLARKVLTDVDADFWRTWAISLTANFSRTETSERIFSQVDRDLKG